MVNKFLLKCIFLGNYYNYFHRLFKYFSITLLSNKVEETKKLLKNGLRALVIWKDSLEVNQNALISSLLVGIWHTDRFLSKCHVINYLRSSCRSLFDERRGARPVLPRPRANIPQYGPHA